MDVEVAVVGSGPGGAVTAALLAEAGIDVLLVEAGPHLAQDSCAPYSRAEMTTRYRNGGLTVTGGGARVAYAEARCVGGGSEVNSGLCHRAPDGVIDDWATSHGVRDLDAEALAPHYAACERDLEVAPTRPGEAPAASRRLADGANALGWAVAEVPRWFRREASREADGPPAYVRRSMTSTYVQRCLDAGGRLLADTGIARIERSGDRWRLVPGSGMAGAGPGGGIRARTVFVACGAVHTPALLRRSGIRANVGDTLRMHPTVKAVARFDDVVNPDGAGIGVHQVREFAPERTIGCSVSTPAHLGVALMDHVPSAAEVLAESPRMAAYYAAVRRGVGRVRVLPRLADPLVGYRLDEADRDLLAEALRDLCRVLLAAGAHTVYPVVEGLGAVRGAADLDRLPGRVDARRSGLMSVHLMGSCPMGEDRALTAVDSFGRVWDRPGLLVADASLFCTALGLNPQNTVMALARRNALAWLDRR